MEILALWSASGLDVAFDVLYTLNTVDLLKKSYKILTIYNNNGFNFKQIQVTLL